MVALLGDAVSRDGRLTSDEHASGSRRHSARTLEELAVLTALDLVAPTRSRCAWTAAGRCTAVFGGHRREGRWVVPERLAVAAVFGEALLDFREAVLQSPRVIVYATVICAAEIVVPDGITVEVSGTSVASSQRGPVARRPPQVGAGPARDRSPGLAGGPGRGVGGTGCGCGAGRGVGVPGRRNGR